MSIERDPQPVNFGQQDFLVYEDTPDDNTCTETHQQVECPVFLVPFLLSSYLLLPQPETIPSNADFSAGSTGFMALVTSKMANLNPSIVSPDEEVCFLAFVFRFPAISPSCLNTVC